MASSGIKLHPVASSDIKWHQLASSDIKWDQVGSGGIKWQVTYYLLLANWYLHLDTCYLILATLNYFTFHSKYFTWITLPTLLFLNYFTLFTSVDVLCFSNLQSFEFSKSNKLNGLASLSLAQLSPSLFGWYLGDILVIFRWYFGNILMIFINQISPKYHLNIA